MHGPNAVPWPQYTCGNRTGRLSFPDYGGNLPATILKGRLERRNQRRKQKSKERRERETESKRTTNRTEESTKERQEETKKDRGRPRHTKETKDKRRKAKKGQDGGRQTDRPTSGGARNGPLNRRTCLLSSVRNNKCFRPPLLFRKLLLNAAPTALRLTGRILSSDSAGCTAAWTHAAPARVEAEGKQGGDQSKTKRD